MLKQLWITGVLAAFSVFGVKVGLGLAAQVYNPSNGRSWRVALVTACLGGYFALFVVTYGVISRFNLLNYLDRLIGLVRCGMMLHLGVATGLLVWGGRLLLADGGREQAVLPLKASLLMIVPCPVCATVVLLNLTLACSLLDLSPLLTTLILFGIFSGLVLATCGLVFPFRRRITSFVSFAGLSMVLIALYFFLTVLIAPIYPEVKAAFAMAASNTPVTRTDHFNTAILGAVVAFLGGTGFVRTYYRRRENP